MLAATFICKRCEMLRDSNPIHEFRGPWGVPIQIGASLILLPLILVDFTAEAYYIFYDLIFVALLIGSILLHELGHAWGSLIQGVPVNRIMLHGGGGFCERRSASLYEQELIVAMGPIVNLAIWATASLLAPVFPPHSEIYWILETLAMINLFLAILNLLPVQPLDGGKLLQLTLRRFMPDDMATRICGGIGLVLAVLWVPMMVLCYLTFGLVLFFIPPIALHWQMVRMAA